MVINNRQELLDAIELMEARETVQKKELTDQFHATVEHFKPINLIKDTISRISSSPGLGGNVLTAMAGMGAGIASKKLLLGRSPGIIKKILGLAVEYGVANAVTGNAGVLKSAGSKLLMGLLGRRKRKTSGEPVDGVEV